MQNSYINMSVQGRRMKLINLISFILSSTTTKNIMQQIPAFFLFPWTHRAAVEIVSGFFYLHDCVDSLVGLAFTLVASTILLLAGWVNSFVCHSLQQERRRWLSKCHSGCWIKWPNHHCHCHCIQRLIVLEEACSKINVTNPHNAHTWVRRMDKFKSEAKRS